MSAVLELATVLFLLPCYSQSVPFEKVVSLQYAELGQPYQNQTSHLLEIQYLFTIGSRVDFFPSKTLTLRTELISTCPEEDSHGLNIIVRHPHGTTTSWDMDSIQRSSVRSLCLGSPTSGTTITEEINVLVSTFCKSGLDFELQLYEEESFQALIRQVQKVRGVGVGRPAVRYLDLRDVDMERHLQVKVESEQETICALVTVQDDSCPFSNTVEEALENPGLKQSMNTLGAFSFPRSRYEGSRGVFLSFFVFEDDSTCGGGGPLILEQDPDRIKNFTYVVTDAIDHEEIVNKVVLSLGCLILLCMATISATYVTSVYRGDEDIALRLRKITEQERRDSDVFLFHQLHVRNPFPRPADHADFQLLNVQVPQSSVADYYQRRQGNGLPKYVAELSRIPADFRDQKKRLKSMFTKSDLYLWLVLTMGIFYGIPAIQLMLNNQQRLKETGDLDLCYYNSLCSTQVGFIQDFNHILSNIWFVGFGFCFLCLVWSRKRANDRYLRMIAERDLDDIFGIPQHFGIFYAMGSAMILQGFFSACYHVCPTKQNYQFDTTFMYVIAVLNILKIYQFRHPDVISNGYKVFFGLGLVLFLEVVGIYYPSRVFWIVVLAIYFLILVLVTGIVYHSGKWSFNLWVFLKIFQSLFRITTTRCQCSENYSSQRLVFVFLLNGINLTFLGVGAIYSPVISTLLLTVFVGNLLVYSVYYFIMKLVHREPFTATPIVFALLALAMWACAFYFYLDPAYETELSPAESRNLNSECLLLKMSDSHDFWHLFGAGGMFSCFMLLLSLDDGLFYVPRTKIRVF